MKIIEKISVPQEFLAYNYFPEIHYADSFRLKIPNECSLEQFVMHKYFEMERMLIMVRNWHKLLFICWLIMVLITLLFCRDILASTVFLMFAPIIYLLALLFPGFPNLIFLQLVTPPPRKQFTLPY
jgi:hypothetical protein